MLCRLNRYYFANKGPSSQSYGFSIVHAFHPVMYGCKSWTIKKQTKKTKTKTWASKNWCFWTVVLENTLESPLDCREIQPVNPKENQTWIFIGRTGAEAEASILWSLDAKNWLIGKDPDAGKDWGWEEKGMTGWDGWIASRTQWTWKVKVKVKSLTLSSEVVSDSLQPCGL